MLSNATQSELLKGESALRDLAIRMGDLRVWLRPHADTKQTIKGSSILKDL